MEVTGSVLVFRLAGGEEEVQKILKHYPLAKAGVSDSQSATKTPIWDSYQAFQALNPESRAIYNACNLTAI